MALLNKYRDRKKLGEILISYNKLTQEQLDEALSKNTDRKKHLGDVLVESGLITEDDLITVLCKQLNFSRCHLEVLDIPSEALDKITDIVSLRKFVAMPYEYDVKKDLLHVAVDDPASSVQLENIRSLTTCNVDFAADTKAHILAAIDKYYGTVSQDYLVKQYSKEQKLIGKEDKEEKVDEGDTSESAVVKLVNHLIEQAARKHTSDIHIEALEDRVRVRNRIDGDLVEDGSYPLMMLGPLVSRLKIMGGMDIAEKRKPQDGRITHIVDGTEFDIRVSILPTVYGEKTVMRLAEKKQLKREKSALGLYPDDLEKFDSIISNPHGIILVTGPTGSGKSTTLYTALSELNKEDVNIITVEDPVEANINGINQVQVNNKADMTFANALRSILRQDPDIIMIGEIRDHETANIAVEASITGHLVVSTLHTNSAVSTITRLENMGIEDYLLADATVGIIAQRLVKKLCPECKKEDFATEEEKEQMGLPLDKPVKIYRPCGCVACNNLGFKGRIGVYEILPMTRKFRNRVAAGAQAEELQNLAIEEGLHTLRMSATRLVLDGITTVSEMNRIARD